MAWFFSILVGDLPPYNVPSPKVRIWDVERGPYGQETVHGCGYIANGRLRMDRQIWMRYVRFNYDQHGVSVAMGTHDNNA
jgi:hypothetical protein